MEMEKITFTSGFCYYGVILKNTRLQSSCQSCFCSDSFSYSFHYLSSSRRSRNLILFNSLSGHTSSSNHSPSNNNIQSAASKNNNNSSANNNKKSTFSSDSTSSESPSSSTRNTTSNSKKRRATNPVSSSNAGLPSGTSSGSGVLPSSSSSPASSSDVELNDEFKIENQALLEFAECALKIQNLLRGLESLLLFQNVLENEAIQRLIEVLKILEHAANSRAISSSHLSPSFNHEISRKEPKKSSKMNFQRKQQKMGSQSNSILVSLAKSGAFGNDIADKFRAVDSRNTVKFDGSQFNLGFDSGDDSDEGLSNVGNSLMMMMNGENENSDEDHDESDDGDSAEEEVGGVEVDEEIEMQMHASILESFGQFYREYASTGVGSWREHVIGLVLMDENPFSVCCQSLGIYPGAASLEERVQNLDSNMLAAVRSDLERLEKLVECSPETVFDWNLKIRP
mmetsp:Transcript_6891/g.12338  ORF Transcript_6891/g.12338 Transcript_6891/m.12338 type:complete len:454 (-) Transcript_6891:1160-2521(-)